MSRNKLFFTLLYIVTCSGFNGGDFMNLESVKYNTSILFPQIAAEFGEMHGNRLEINNFFFKPTDSASEILKHIQKTVYGNNLSDFQEDKAEFSFLSVLENIAKTETTPPDDTPPPRGGYLREQIKADFLKGEFSKYGIEQDELTGHLQPIAEPGEAAYYEADKMILQFEGWSESEIEKRHKMFMENFRQLKMEEQKINVKTVEPIEPTEPKKEEKKKKDKISKLIINILSRFKIGKCAGRPYLINKNQALEIGSSQYRDFISRVAYMETGNALSETAVREIAQIQRGIAMFEGEEIAVGVRIMTYEDATYLDLCNTAGNIIKIDSTGWKICTDAPVYFFRPPHVKPLPIPKKDGNLNALKDILSFADETDFILIRAAILFYLRGRIGDRGTMPVLRLRGGSGTGKTTRAKIIKSLFDPGTPESRTMTKEPRDLFINAKNQYVLVFDNVSHLTGELQDALCSLASRGGFGKKKNYTDDDETIFEECRPVIINGITFKVQADLQGRMIDVELSPITKTGRKTEKKVWQFVDEKRPEILGGLLNALALTLAEIENNNVENEVEYPRLADFAEFTLYMEKGNGWQEGETIAALFNNYSQGLDAIVEGVPLISIVIDFIENRETKCFNGTAAELLKVLTKFVKNGKDDKEIKDDREILEKLKLIPDNAAKLGVFLTRNEEVLQNKNIQMKKNRTKAGRVLKLWSGVEPSDFIDELPF